MTAKRCRPSPQRIGLLLNTTMRFEKQAVTTTDRAAALYDYTERHSHRSGRDYLKMQAVTTTDRAIGIGPLWRACLQHERPPVFIASAKLVLHGILYFLTWEGRNFRKRKSASDILLSPA